MKRFSILAVFALFFCRNMQGTELVGRMAGGWNVGETGAAVYSIPIELQQSANEFSPSLSLFYNSQAGNGLAGYGWSLSGLSSIAVGPRNVYFDGTADGVHEGDDNAYYLDGMRLLLVEGENGKQGASYRTESEQYSIITIDSVLAETPAIFTIKKTDGTIYRYGSSTGRMQYSDAACYEWKLDYVEDRLGNYIVYEYAQEGFMLYPTAIHYGHNRHSSAFQPYSVEFIYESRPDTIYLHQFDSIQAFSKRLHYIRCRASAASFQYMYYKLSYTGQAFSHLTSVKQYGSGDSYPATVFDWQDIPEYSLAQSIPSVNTGGIDVSRCHFFAADIDNDGFTELTALHSDTIAGHPYQRATMWKKGIDDTFSTSGAYHVQAGFSISDMFLSLRCGGAVAHVTTTAENSILLPCFEVDVNDTRCMKFYDMNDGMVLSYPLRSNTGGACHIITDFDRDGMDDILLVEQTKLSGVYPATIIHFDMTHSTMSWSDFTLDLAERPCRISSADFNGDSMPDLLVCTTGGYYIYWNHAGVFSDSDRYYGTEFNECDVLETGDVNGDGLPDLVLNKHHSITWKCAVNQGNKSNPFSFHNITKLQEMEACNNEYDCEAYCMLQDMDGDGKSDIVAGVLVCGSKKQFRRGNLVVLKSEGTFFTLLDSLSFSSKNTFPAYKRMMLGDFDGDGVPEILYYGGMPNSPSTNMAWHRLALGGYTPATNRIRSTTDGLGTVHRVQYDVLTNDDVYQIQNTAAYPLLTLRAPLPVARRIETMAGNDTLWSEYSYKDAVLHWQGKGLLGFRERSVSASSGTTSVIRNGINTEYYVPYKTSERVYASDGTLWKTDTLFTFFDAKGPKRYFMHVDFNRSEDKATNYYDMASIGYDSYGVPVHEEKKDEMFGAESTYTYWQSGGRYIKNLPVLIETTLSGGTTHQEGTERTEYTRDTGTGQPLTCRKHRNGTLIETDLYTYNAAGQMLTHTTIHGGSADSLTTSYSYNTQGLVAQKTDPMGLVTSYQYNARGLLTKETDYLGVSATYGYDGMARHKHTISPREHLYTYYQAGDYGNAAYKIYENEWGQPARTTYYDGLGRKVAKAVRRFDGRWLYTDYAYLPNGQLGFVSDPHTSSAVSTNGTHSTYDNYGRLTSQTDSQGKTSTWSYQGSTVYSLTDGVERMERHSHRDHVTTVEDNSGYVDYEIDYMGQVVEIYHNGMTATLDYDEFGNTTQTVDMQGTTRNYTYDANGYPLLATQGTSTRHTQYDKFGRLLSRTFHDADIADTHTNYTYNALDQLVCDSSSNHTYTYTYDNYGRLKTENLTVKADSTETLLSTYKYNSRHQVSQKTTTLNGLGITLTEKYTFAYDWRTAVTLNDSLVWRLDEEDERGFIARTSNHLDSIAWSNDIYGHLLSEHVRGRHNLSLAYAYDHDTGNTILWNSDTCSYDNLNRLTGWRNLRYSYDNEGNMLAMNPLGQMSYNGFRLASVNASQSMGIPGHSYHEMKYLRSMERPALVGDAFSQVEYAYDGDGKRVWMKKKSLGLDPIIRQEQVQGQSQFSTTGMRYYLGENCEIDQSYENYKRYFYYVGGSPYNAPAVVLADSSSAIVYQIYRDNLGSVVMYASASDSTQHFRYTPWGLRIKADIPSSSPYAVDNAATPFIRFYTGHEEIALFHLLNTNARLYDPVTGRFYSPDPILATSGGPLAYNPYIYAHNNPLSYVDPDGEFAWLIPVLAAAVSGFTNVMYNKDNIHNFWQGLGYFGVGAAAGAAGSLAAAAVPLSIGGFAGGAILGGIGGAVSGFTMGGGNALLSGQNFWKSALTGTWQGAVFGAVAGGLTEGIRALHNNNNFWTGNWKGAPLSSNSSTERTHATINHYDEGKNLTPHEIGEIGELQAIEDFKMGGGEITGRHAAYRVEGVDGYGITDAIGKKGKDIYIIEAKNGKNPRYTEFQKQAFPKMKAKAKIEFFGPKAKSYNLPSGQLSNYELYIKRYHQYTFPH